MGGVKRFRLGVPDYSSQGIEAPRTGQETDTAVQWKGGAYLEIQYSL